MATVYINGVKAGCMAIGTTEIANILKGTSDPSSSIGDNGQLYLKYGDYEKHYFMDNKIVVVENKNDATDLKLYIVGLTKDTNFLAITDTDLLAYLSDIPEGYLKACSTYDTADSTTQTGILAVGSWGSGMGIHTYIPGWTQYKAGTFYGVIDLTQSPVPASGYPSYQENSFVDPDTFTDGGILDSFAKVNNQWQNLIGTNIDDIQSGGGGESPIVFKNYAKFDGSQGIILPWKINADYKVEVTFYQTTYTDAENIIGNTSAAVYSHLTPYQGGYWSSLGSNEGLISGLSWSAGEHTYITNNGNGYNEFDGVEVQSYTPTTINGYYTIGERVSTSIIRSYIKSYKIYSISQGTLLHELVPCLYDGVTPCLYDKIGKMFFCNGIESVMDTIPTE